ncbi:MAG: hypothetical protein JXR97_04910, partial [Planctomycetes bacterium]|nr:hypothetical protein [Planctomycetota bacterium]
VLVIGGALLACLLTATQPEPPAPDIDHGKFENGVYKHDYFGLEIRMPEGWKTFDKLTTESTGKKKVPSPEELDKLKKTYEKNSGMYLLLEMVKHHGKLPDNPTPEVMNNFDFASVYPSGFFCTAQKLDESTRMLDETQIIKLNSANYNQADLAEYGVSMEPEGEPEAVEIGGKQFYRHTLKIKGGLYPVINSTFTRKAGGYILVFSFQYAEKNKDAVGLDKFINGIKVGR